MEEKLDTFPRLMLHHARVRAAHPATREKDLGIWQTWTWAEVADEVRALACGLAAEGFKPGMHLAIVGDNRPRLYWSMLAAQVLRGVPVPMYQDAPAAEFVYVLNDAEIDYALVEDQEQVDKLLEAAPQVPTLAEQGLTDYEVTLWFGMWAPAGTPGAVVQKLNATVNAIVQEPPVREQFAKLGMQPAPMKPEEFARFVRSEIDDYQRVIRAAGIKPQ